MRRKRKLLLAIAVVLLVAIIALAIAGMGTGNTTPGIGTPAPPPAQGTGPGTGNMTQGTGHGTLLPPPASGCGNLTVYVLNVSQADSIFIITPGNKTILIDAGSAMKPNSSDNAVSFLKRNGVRRIDYFVATHYHEDHIGGTQDVFSRFDVGSVYYNGDCADYPGKTADAFNAYKALKTFIAVKTPTDMPSDGCLSEAKLLFPYNQPGGCSKTNENDNSVLLRLAYGNTSFLFTGDCDANCEAAAMQQGVSLKADFLKVGHHGSYTSSTIPFLDAVGAEYYTISADQKRSISDGYFHPREVTLEKLYARSPSGTFRTDVNGDIMAVSDGSAVTVSPAFAADKCDIFMGYTNASQSSYSIVPALAGSCP